MSGCASRRRAMDAYTFVPPWSWPGQRDVAGAAGLANQRKANAIIAGACRTGRRAQSLGRPCRSRRQHSTPARSSAADHTRADSSNVHLASRPRPGPATPTLLRSGLVWSGLAWPRSDAACLACLVSDGTSFQTLLFSFGNRRPVHAAPNSPSLSTARGRRAAATHL